ncbi:MAG: hypothetical protein N2Z22_00540 [Turneriella sp.]|nr:hypothetical protein [Turneriella sp.]
MTTFPLEILSEDIDSAGFVHTRVLRPASFHYTPGQYVVVFANDGQKRYFALASHPEEKELLFLTRQPLRAATFSLPQGTGFGCDFRDKRPWLFITHGSGISALRPAILERRRRGLASDTLIYGIRQWGAQPALDVLGADFPLHKIYALSAQGERVQQRLRSHALSHYGAVLLVGSQEMMTEVRQILAENQFPASAIYTNY